MTEQNPAHRPGHLDIDAVSAFVDRDFSPDELAMIAIHLHECPACHREVLEIRTTVVLLASLPRYTPRRSFCLGHEHARASRRRRFGGDRAGTGPLAPVGLPAAAAGAGRGAGWLPGLQATAVLIGALLLLVTSSDLTGMPSQPADWLSAPESPTVEFLSAPAPEMAPPVPTAARVADADTALFPDESESESAFGIASGPAGGTASDDGASEEVLTGDEPADDAVGIATRAAMAVTQAVPTPALAAARGAEPASGPASSVASGSEPSRLRLVQLALAFALAWLVVSIVGLRWVRGLR